MITATHTFPTLERITRREIIQRFLRESGLGDYGTATGGNAATVVDTTMLQSSQYPDDGLKGAWTRNASGEIRTITDYKQGNGMFTVSPTFTTAVEAGDDYEIWRTVHPKRVLDTLDQILKEDCYLPYWTLLTEVPDGDMEQSNTTDWAVQSATIAKVTAEPQMWGKRYLSVLTTAPSGYAAPAANLRVVPGRRYHLSAMVRCSTASTTATLVAYDETNGEVIDTKVVSSLANVRLWMEFPAPEGCHEISFRLGSIENGTTTYWAQAVLFAMEDNAISLPWWVRDKSQVKGIFATDWTQISASVFAWMPRHRFEVERWDFIDSAFGRGQLRLVSQFGAVSGPVLIMGTRNESGFADDDTDTKHVDANWIAAALKFRVFDQLKRLPNSSLLNMEWVNAAQAQFQQEWDRERRKQSQRLADAMQAGQPDVLVYGDRVLV